MKTVSVIVPAKNRHEFTSEALFSIYKQNLPKNINLEVIVIDDLSEPPLSLLLKKEFPEVKFIRNNTNKHGPGPSRNIGLKKAKGNYIAFLDNDDQWKSSFLKTSIYILDKTRSPAVTCLSSPYFYGEYPFRQKLKWIILNIIKTTGLLLCYIFNSRQLAFSGFYLSQISHMVFDGKAARKSKFDEELIAAEDWEFMVQCTIHKQINIIPSPLVKFRYEVKSNTHSKLVREKKWTAYRKMLSKIPSTHKKGILYKLFLQYISLFS